MSRGKNFPQIPGGSGELRTYKSGKKYRKLLPEERKIGVNKPDDPRAVRLYGRWYLPLPVLADDARVLPDTKPDSIAYDHMEKRGACSCEVCKRPEAERWKRKWRREHGLMPVRDRRPRASSQSQ